MSWVAQAGRSVGKGGGGGRGRDHSSGEEEEDGGDGIPMFHGVPLCGAAMCSGKGMPPRRLPRPGIDCVNPDRPCLPCDIVNLKLRVSVAGAQVKRAVAEAQKRYFCDVWNLLFGWMFPGHRKSRCLNLKTGDEEVRCGSSRRSQGRRQVSSRDPRKLIPPDNTKWVARQPKQQVFDDTPVPEAPVPTPRRAMPPKPRVRGGAELKYNLWNLAMPDSIKKKSGTGGK